ncbi:MCP four helix bundle domain-containing protein [Cohnella rhizosphaerae]|uniref:MCP four helix bundle domain-containing protein n=1 Tax=Cohnella rhizosphaerae TaxID=1457232 RepID=A0A9X4QVS2_9BACL|nr:MCP four helix bundle domain-containing protein [Cohnella rhizosphaerae]MDG0812879.1 MCP four helix bundle domain-containing protein [Cohnella rhizosphaerae]
MNWTVGKKMVGAFSAIVVALAALGFISLVNMSLMNKQSQEIGTDWLNGVETMSSIKIDLQEITNLYYQSLMAADAAAKKKAVDQMNALFPEIENHVNEYKGSVANEKDQKLYASLEQDWEQFKATYAASAKNAGDADGASKAGEAFKKLENDVDQLIDFNHEGAASSVKG